MKAIWARIFAIGLLAIAGCGGGGGLAALDGGPVGTGISASLSGNVTSVSAAAQGSTAAEGAVEASVPAQIRVTIDEVPGIESLTDADGNFELEGDFSGQLTLRFRATSIDATEQLHIPAGSTIVLEDVRLAPRMVQMGAIRQLGFSGVVAHADCAAGVLLVNDHRTPAGQFRVQLSSTSAVVDGSGNALQCAAIANGEEVIVRGTMQPADQTVAALGVVVDPQATDEVQFTGVVMMINCTSDVLMVSGPTPRSGMPGMPGRPAMAGMPGMAGMAGRSRVRLSSATQITDAGGQTLRCQDIRPGDHVEVSGVINNSRNPGIIDAQTMKVSSPQ